MSEVVPSFRKPSSWFGIFGPAGLPSQLVHRLNMEVDKALTATDVRNTFDENGMSVLGGTPEDFAKLIADGIQRYGEIIRVAHIEPE